MLLKRIEVSLFIGDFPQGFPSSISTEAFPQAIEVAFRHCQSAITSKDAHERDSCRDAGAVTQEHFQLDTAREI
jgi:hypothetical protein